MAIDVEISEVGPRDGLQNTAQVMATADKCAWIAGEAAAGVREIEVTSFVPHRLMPQFADADAVVRHALAIPGLTVAALVPNLKGAERALAAGVHKLSFTLSVSRSHSLANVRKTPEDQVAELARIVAHRNATAPRAAVSVGLSTAFGCSIEGPVDEAAVVRLAVAAAGAGADDLCLSDTVGYANPAQVRRLIRKVRAAVGSRLAGVHLHDTRGLGLANTLVALEEGLRTVDASLAGIGGCPHAPGASGNIATEDLAFMLAAMGLATGIDLDRLLAVRHQLAAAMPGAELHGRLALAGLPKGMAQ